VRCLNMEAIAPNPAGEFVGGGLPDKVGVVVRDDMKPSQPARWLKRLKSARR
jgi:hypothetical protein